MLRTRRFILITSIVACVSSVFSGCFDLIMFMSERGEKGRKKEEEDEHTRTVEHVVTEEQRTFDPEVLPELGTDERIWDLVIVSLRDGSALRYVMVTVAQVAGLVTIHRGRKNEDILQSWPLEEVLSVRVHHTSGR